MQGIEPLVAWRWLGDGVVPASAHRLGGLTIGDALRLSLRSRRGRRQCPGIAVGAAHRPRPQAGIAVQHPYRAGGAT